MKKIILTLLLSISFISNAQVGIGTTSPNASSVLELQATEGGLLVPRMTKSQREAIAPANASTFTANPEKSTKGLLVYQTDNAEGFYYFDGADWKALGGAGAKDTDWAIVGNNMYNANPGNVGVGVTTPVAKFHVKGTRDLPFLGNPGPDVTTTTLSENFESGIPSSFTTSSWSISSPGQSGSSSASVAGPFTSETKSLSLSLTIPADNISATVSFWYRISTESGYDFFRFKNGSTKELEDSGEKLTWQQVSFALSPGVNNLSWEYYKDGLYDGVSDAVWIDNIVITETNPGPLVGATPGSYVLRLDDTTQQDGYVLVCDADGNAYWDDPLNATPEGLQKLSLSGFDLSITDANTVDLSTLFSDDQTVDKLNLTSSNFLEIAIEDDGVADETIDLSSLIGTDNQTIDEFSLTGTTLSLSLFNDGVAPLTLDIAPYVLSQYTFENALIRVANDVKLGGALTKNTTLSSTNDNFILQGNTRNIFEVNPYKDFIMFGGATPVPYSTSSYPAPSDGDTMTDSGGADYTVKIVAGFYSSETVDGSTTDDDGGTAISLGDSEYIVDGFNEILLNGSFSSLENDSFGRSDKRWVEVFSKNGLNNTSDMNLKTNIKELNRGLKEILALRTISYQWKDEKKGGKQIPENLQQRKIGFSAQQLQTIIPEVVHTHSWIPADEKGNYKYKKNKNLGVYYSDMIPVQVKAIQEQQEEIKELELLISNLENTLNSLKNK
jgi:hypothetical protein